MRSFRDVLRTKPGLVKTAVLSQVGESTLVGLSMWNDEAAYEKAMSSIQAPPATGPAETLRESPPVMRRFMEI